MSGPFYFVAHCKKEQTLCLKLFSSFSPSPTFTHIDKKSPDDIEDSCLTINNNTHGTLYHFLLFSRRTSRALALLNAAQVNFNKVKQWMALITVRCCKIRLDRDFYNNVVYCIKSVNSLSIKNVWFIVFLPMSVNSPVRI